MLEMTDSAAKRIVELIKDAADDFVGLRVFVQGGGCSGFKYGFKFEKEDGVDPDQDMQHDIKGVNIIMDPISMSYLDGSSIEYTTEFGDQFSLKNPNSTGTCGCGESFSV